jgi:uncharacterized protein (TIGR02996 family)
MTFQVREALIFRGQQRQIRALPLQSCTRPVPKVETMSTGCWRGYIGTWEIRDDALHLVHLAAPHRHGPGDGLDRMFPEHAGSAEAHWFSGEIVPDYVARPAREWLVDDDSGDPWPLQFVWFTLVIHRGKLLLETSVDLLSGLPQARLTRHVDALFPAAELPFLHAIQENAEDAAAKLVFADWLEEQGDPRAPLLRGEVQRMRTEGPERRWVEPNPRWDIPSGYVPPEDLLWYWRWLAGIPARTPEDAADDRRRLGPHLRRP